MDDLSANIGASIPQCCDGWAATKAGYRFLDNPNVEWPAILSPHRDKTIERMQGYNRVLCIQDTTELDFTGHPETQGLGRLNHDYRQGMYCHPTLAVSETGVVLGVVDAWMWARKPKGEDDILESVRWTEGYERVAELMTAAHNCVHAAHWLVRAKHNRVTNDGKLWDRLGTQCVLGTVQFSLPRAAKRNGRMVELNLRVERVALPASRHAPAVGVTAILAREDNPPPGETRIEWRLLTDEVVTNLEEAVLRIDWYRLRWMIEIFFRTLKSGCKVEELQLNTKDRLEKALVIYMILAWRVLMLMTLGRQLPDLSCEIVFGCEEWQAAWIVRKKTPLPSTPPTLGEMVLIIASFGGFLGRKGDSTPGAEVLWRGLQRVRDFSEGINAVTQSYELKLE
jgi:hypothetical protein